MQVKLLRPLLVSSNIEPDAAGSVVEMEDGRANELLARDPPLVEKVGGKAKAAAPLENKMAAEPANKADAEKPAAVTAPAKRSTK